MYNTLAGIASGINSIYINTQGLSVYFSDVKSSLELLNGRVYSVMSAVQDIDRYLWNTLNASINSINNTVSNIYDDLEGFYILFSQYYYHINEFINSLSDYLNINYIIDLDNEIISYSITETMHDMLLNLYNEIENQANPLSEDNKPAFDAALTNLKDNTFVGNAFDMAEAGTTIVDSIKEPTPVAHYYVKTLPVTFFGVKLGGDMIDIDLSWYGAYRDETFKFLRAFIYIGWVIMFVRRLPAILNGAPMELINEIQPDVPEPDVPQVFERISVDDDGVVTKHETITKDGNVTITQRHKK